MTGEDSIARDIPLRLISPARFLLRPVRKDTPEYYQLRDSMASYGHLLNSVLVRPNPDAPGHFEVADGMHRYTVAQDLRWEDLQCCVREMDDDEYRRAQFEANAQHIGTDPIDYAERLEELRERIEEVEGRPMTLPDLAVYCNKSSEWVREMLGLNKLAPSIKPLVSRGEIPLSNARVMARLPWGIQTNLVEMAMTAKRREFRLACSAALNEYREGIKNGFINRRCMEEIVPYLDFAACQAEMESFSEGTRRIVRDQITDPLDAWKLAILWVLHMDPETIEKRKEVYRQQALQRFDEAERRKEARLRAKETGRKRPII